jgi:translation initiation factor 1A
MTIKKGGKKGKKGKKTSNGDDIKRKIVYKEEDQEYCLIEKLLGSCRLEGKCFDGKIRLCHIRGSMRKKVWVKVGDVVIISLREFEDNKCDVIYLYNKDEVKYLIKLGELPADALVNDIEIKEEDDIGFDFTGKNDEDDEDKIKEIDIDNI